MRTDVAYPGVVGLKSGSSLRKLRVEARNNTLFQSLGGGCLGEHLHIVSFCSLIVFVSHVLTNGERSIGGTLMNKKFLAPASLEKESYGRYILVVPEIGSQLYRPKSAKITVKLTLLFYSRLSALARSTRRVRCRRT